MRFAVDAVPAAAFAQWVSATHEVGPMLDARTYADLAKPSETVAPFTYGDVAPDLFNHVLSSAVQPNDPALLADMASQRTDK
jgi:cytochrome o ubiquinol oxidase subunit 2